MKRGSLSLLFFLCASLQAQTGVAIRGYVCDDSTKAPVGSANVFIANSMIGTSSDSTGFFELKSVPPGVHELVASCVGYHMSVRKMQLFSAGDQAIDFTLKPKSLDFAPVEVTAPRPEEWKENLKKFAKLLLGTTPEAEGCIMKNPEALVLFAEPSGRLEARNNEELMADNEFLGYRLHVNLGTFRFDGRWLTSQWKVRFEDLLPDNQERASGWRKNRATVYQGSLRHFIRSLINGEPADEGFEMYYSESGDLRKLGYYLPSFKRRNVISQVSPNVWKVQFRNYLIVVYEKKKVHGGFRSGGYDSRLGSIRLYPDSRPQISLLSLQKESLLVDLNGQLLDDLALKVSGDWGNEGLARSLPLEYRGEEQ